MVFLAYWRHKEAEIYAYQLYEGDRPHIRFRNSENRRERKMSNKGSFQNLPSLVTSDDHREIRRHGKFKCGHVVTFIIYSIPILVNDIVSSCGKHDSVEKLVGSASSCE